jgi:hypothetical protein
MLDVHPPHEKVHSWTQFFIHIAAITIGLLIAIGLGQTVEYFHHRHQLWEARRELSVEAEGNRGQLTKNLQAVRTMTAELDANMALLRATQTPPAKIGSKLVYNWIGAWPLDGTWQAVKQNGSLGLMPHEELHYYTYLYDAIAAVKSGLIECGSSMDRAAAISRRSPDGNLTARDIEELITATSDAQAKITYCTELLHYEELGLQKTQQ